MIVNAKPINGNMQGRRNKRHKVEDEDEEVMGSPVSGQRSSSLGRKRSSLLAYDTVEFMLDQQENNNHKNDTNKRAVAGYNKTMSRNDVIGSYDIRNLDQIS